MTEIKQTSFCKLYFTFNTTLNIPTSAIVGATRSGAFTQISKGLLLALTDPAFTYSLRTETKILIIENIRFDSNK